MDLLKTGLIELRRLSRRSLFARRMTRIGRKAVRSATGWAQSNGFLTPAALEVRPVEDGWMIAHRGSSLPIRVYGKKQEAVREAKKLAREQGVPVEIQGKRSVARRARTTSN